MTFSARRRRGREDYTSKVEPGPGVLSTRCRRPTGARSSARGRGRGPCRLARRLKNGSKIRFRCSGRDAAAVVGDADADGSPGPSMAAHPPARPAGLDGVQQQVDQRRAAARPRRRARAVPGTADRTSMVTEWARAVGSISRATAVPSRRNVHDVARRTLAARQAQEVLRDAAAAQDLLARDGGALARSGRASPVRGSFAQDPLDARQHGGERRVQLVREARGQQARARPGGATRPAAPRRRAGPRCRARLPRRASAVPSAS